MCYKVFKGCYKVVTVKYVLQHKIGNRGFICKVDKERSEFLS